MREWKGRGKHLCSGWAGPRTLYSRWVGPITSVQAFSLVCEVYSRDVTPCGGSGVALPMHSCFGCRPILHREKRRFLRSSLNEMNVLLSDAPGLLGPKLVTVLTGMVMARDEIHWLYRHANTPAPKAKHKANPADYQDVYGQTHTHAHTGHTHAHIDMCTSHFSPSSKLPELIFQLVEMRSECLSCHHHHRPPSPSTITAHHNCPPSPPTITVTAYHHCHHAVPVCVIQECLVHAQCTKSVAFSVYTASSVVVFSVYFIDL